MIHTENLLPNTSRYINLTGDKVLAGGYSSSISNGLHTLIIATGMKGAVGKIFLQGTLEKDPQENDWFNIPFNNGEESVEFPIYKDPEDKNSEILSNGKVYSYRFDCLPVWVRVKIDRTYIENWDKIDPSEFGDFRYINISYS